MLTQICQYLRNWFEKAKYFGDFKIQNGILTYADGTALPLLNGQYFRIVGSNLNDGVFQLGEALTDEEFNGAVWAMSIPRDFLARVEEFAVWYGTYQTAVNSPFASETIGGYSYTLKNSNDMLGGLSLQNVICRWFAPWRKI